MDLEGGRDQGNWKLDKKVLATKKHKHFVPFCG
jgi:hypothetical protein